MWPVRLQSWVIEFFMWILWGSVVPGLIGPIQVES